MWLSDAELADATGRRQFAAQARVLTGWGVPYRRRPDGSLLVSRSAFDATMQGAMVASGPANGLNWNKRV